MAYKGFMLYDRDWLIDNWLLESDLQAIASLGFNTVSIQFFWTTFEDQENQPYVYNETRLGKLTQTIQWALDAGLKVILSNRVTFADATQPAYRGWLNSYGNEGWNMAFTEPLFSRFRAWIQFLLTQYPQVAGVIPVDYPFHSAPRNPTLYYGVLPQIISAYREVCDKPYFLSPEYKQAKYLIYTPPPEDSNTIIVIDGYGDSALYQCNRTYLQSMFDDIINGTGGFTEPFIGAVEYCETYGVDFFIDEFGTYSGCCENADKLQWLRDILEWFEQYAKAGWTHHYGWSNQVGSVLNRPSHVVSRPNTLALLSAYAQLEPNEGINLVISASEGGTTEPPVGTYMF